MLSLYLSMIPDEHSKSKFEQLYTQYSHTMLWVALNILHDKSLAEDAVHDAFLVILNHLENISLENCNKTRAFFVLIVRNLALDQIRKRKQLNETDLDEFIDFLPDPQLNPEQNWLDNEGSQKILAALGKVKQTYADVLTLHVSCEMNDQEIAQTLNISPESARVRLHRGRKQLARYLKDDE